MKNSKNKIEDKWLKAIEEFSPDIIGTTIVEDSYVYCDRLLGLAKKKFNIPVVAGGVAADDDNDNSKLFPLHGRL